MRKWLKRLGYAGLTLFLLLWTATTVFGVYFTIRPRVDQFDDPDTFAGHPVESVTITTEDGINLSAWYIKASDDQAVILLAGIDGNRTSCRNRGEFFLDRGYSVLLPDLRASGRSEGRAVTIGWRERKDLVACFDFLKDRGHEYIGADGISLGAATICYAMPDLPDLSFAIIESSYDTLVNAVRNRLAMFKTPHFIAYPYYVGFGVIAGVPPWRMRPVDYVAHASAPTLVLAGDSEVEIPVHETQSIYERCAAPLKRLHFFKGAGHWDFLGRYTEEYTQVVDSFLNEASTGREATRLTQRLPHAP
ncbi:MAG TPA: CocE/NonD family hydrolase [Candidatus Hydrogenedentes bacterium]|jgi:esterase/lipase|nr:hypothetical protein [Candidatus Hydrogenedentota bacterium]HOC67446.1 CocE/NonD family hydrolase [Candidatus Hydrogenedentota bacterium]HOH30338.1 CocE/NonD family hydrolase [Candidatus Hydrogenedentota bacterium]